MVTLRAMGYSLLAPFILAAIAGGNASGDSTAKSPTARVASPTGLLAVKYKGDVGWQILGQGDFLSKECEIRAAAGQPCVLDIDGARLYLAPEVRLLFPGRSRHLVLQSGRICLKTNKDASWRVDVADSLLEVTPQSTAELVTAAGQAALVQVTSGTIRRLALDEAPLPAGATGKRLVLLDAKKPGIVAEVTPAEKKRIEAWTTAFPPAQGLGQLVVKDAQSASPVRLDVSRYRVNVVLQPPVALVQIDQSFYNPLATQQEGTFVFNLPRGASVSRFAMYVTPQQLIEGELLERQQASNIYDSIVHWQRDPGILEQIGDNLFKMRVFPVPARNFKRILLDYTIPLESGDGHFQFQLPLFSDLKPIGDFQLSGTILGPTLEDTSASPSHAETTFSKKNGGLKSTLPQEKITFSLQKKDYQPQSDFLLSFRQKIDGPASARSYLAEPLPPSNPQQPQGNPSGTGATALSSSASPMTYFLATLPPRPRGEASGPPSPADVAIVVDTSSATQGNRLLRAAVRNVMLNLLPTDRFRLMATNIETYTLTDHWQAAGTREIAAALKMFDDQISLGDSDLLSGLRDLPSMADFDDNSPNRRRMVLYIGSGKHSTGQAGISGFRERIASQYDHRKATFLAVIVQNGANLEPVESLARATGGLVFDLASPARSSRELLAWLLSGMPSPEQIAKLEVAGAAHEDLFYPTAWLPGTPLKVLGRTASQGPIGLKLTVHRDGKDVVIGKELSLDSRHDDVFLGRFWAQRKLEQLLNQETQTRQTPQQQPLKANPPIVALSQEWSLLSPYTAFLVLESEADYVNRGIDRRQRRRYWAPEDSKSATAVADTARFDAAEDRKEEEKAQQDYLQQSLREAKEALALGIPRYGVLVLRQIRDMEPALKSDEYRELLHQCLAAERRGAALHALGPQRGMFDPTARPSAESCRPDLFALLSFAPATDSDFLADHPYARQLLREIQITPKSEDVAAESLQDVISRLRSLPGVNLSVDYAAIRNTTGDDAFGDDASKPAKPAAKRHKGQLHARVSPESAKPIGIFGPGRMSLLDYVRFALGQHQLVLVEEPHRLLVTSADAATNDPRLHARLYPVADLLLGNRPAELHLLANPYLDREEAARRRIRAKLDRPINMQFHEKPLREVVAQFAETINDTILVDWQGLADQAIDGNTILNGTWQNVPARQSLRWILEQAQLAWVIHGDTLLITTPQKAESYENAVIRLHSASGVICGRVWTAEEAFQHSGQWPESRYQPSNRGFGMGGGGMGGMGGGMGGMGGGMGMGGMGGGVGMGGMGGMMGGGMGGGGGFAGGMGGGMSAGPGIQPSPASMSVAGSDANLQENVGIQETLNLTDPHLEMPEIEDPFFAAEPTSPVPTMPKPPMTTTPQNRNRPVPPPAVTPPRLPLAWQPMSEIVELDGSSLTEMVTNIVESKSWVENGGAFFLSFFNPTLDLVVSASDDIHDQIDVLFDRLRKIPVPRDSTGKLKALTAPLPLPEDVDETDENSLLDVIKNNAAITSWSENGGNCTVTIDKNRLVVGVSASPDVHCKVSRLLTLLHRSRYESLCHQRPWQPGGNTNGLAILPILAEAQAAGSPDVQRPPKPLPEELARLAVRSEPETAVWQRTDPVGGGETIAVHRTDQRVEIIAPHLVARLQGREAAVAAPDFGLVEIGNWGETVRQLVDNQLPWMPHRSNADLARAFRIEKLSSPSGRGAGGECDIVRLRLVPRALAESAQTRIEMAFAVQGGYPVAWESYCNGKLASKLRFSRGVHDAAGSDDTISWEDASGRVLACWSVPGPKINKRRVPELTADWPDYVILDRRNDEPAVDRSLKLAIGAMQAFDWPLAARHLDSAAAEHPHHPLIVLLKAWCHEHDRKLGNREPLLEGLRDVVRSNRMGLIRFLGNENLQWLTAIERHDLLLLQPESSRNVVDWDNLVSAARAAGRSDEAIAHAYRAIATEARDSHRFQRYRQCVELLLENGRDGDALTVARNWAAGLKGDGGPKLSSSELAEQLASMAEILGKPLAATAEKDADVDSWHELPAREVQRAVLHDDPFGDVEGEGKKLPSPAQPSVDARKGAGGEGSLPGPTAREACRMDSDRLFQRAVELPDLPQAQRSGYYCRWAANRRGAAACRILVKAAELMTPGSADRRYVLSLLSSELTTGKDADLAAQLARQTHDASLRQVLISIQIGLTTDVPAQTELAWQIYRSHLLSDEYLGWICTAWNEAWQPRRVVEVLETKIRLGRLLDSNEAMELARAYSQLGRARDVRRAQSATVVNPSVH